MDIRQILYFVRIAQTGSYSAAADELNISQSSLSKQILALEEELQCQLFDRSKRKIALTELGEHYLTYAFQFESLYNTMMVEMEQYRTPTPRLSIASIPVVAQYGLYNFVFQFRTAYPWIKFQFEEQEASAILYGLTSRQVDLAFVRSNYLDPTQFGWVDIYSDQMVAVFSRKHRFADRASISLSELSKENFIMFDKGTVVRELAVDACKAAGFMPKIAYTSYRTESISGLVTSNAGIALMMRRVIEYHLQPEAVIVPLEETIESKVVLAFLKYHKFPQAAKMFLDLVKKMLV